MEKYLLGIDEGTTSTRAIIFNKNGEVINVTQEEIKQYYPHPSWVEHDPMEIYSKTLACMLEVTAASNLTFDDIAGIGITNQRETIVVWDKKTGKPVYNAIVWQSQQSIEVAERMEKYKDIIKEKTGLLISPYFSASKIRWLFDTYPELEQRAKKGELLCGTIDSWLIYKLTGNKVHATDVSNASRTLLFNIHTLDWDDDLLKLFGVPKCMLPEVKESSCIFGYVFNSLLHGKLPICGVAGDQQAALFGQCCFDKGDIKNTYGTGCFALMNIGDQIVKSEKGLLTTVAWKMNGQVNYAFEGSVFIGGAAVQWLRDEMRMFNDPIESEKYASSISSTEGVYVVPAFTGLGTPYWDNECRGAVFGLTRGSNKEIFIRATLEAIAYQSMDVIKTMESEAGVKIKSISVDGGSTKNAFLMQFQSDIAQSQISIQRTAETTALGVAYLAGLAIGYYKDINEIRELREIKKYYTPIMSRAEANELYSGWQLAVTTARMFKPKNKNK